MSYLNNLLLNYISTGNLLKIHTYPGASQRGARENMESRIAHFCFGRIAHIFQVNYANIRVESSEWENNANSAHRPFESTKDGHCAT